MIMIQHICGDWTNIFTPFGGIGVAIFLFLSGFGLNESYKINGIEDYWQKKILRVVLPYALFRFVCLLVNFDTNWLDFLLDIVCYKSSYWYIDFTMRCYLVFWIGRKYFAKHTILILMIFSLYTFFAMDALRAEQALSFPLGVLVSLKYDYIQEWSKSKLYVLMSLFGLVGMTSLVIKQFAYIRSLQGTNYYTIVELGIKLPLAITCMIVLSMLPIRFKHSLVLGFCGVLSLELYLVHMRVIPMLVENSFMQGWVVIIISMLLAYSFHAVVNNLIHKLRNNGRETSGIMDRRS